MKTFKERLAKYQALENEWQDNWAWINDPINKDHIDGMFKQLDQ